MSTSPSHFPFTTIIGGLTVVENSGFKFIFNPELYNPTWASMTSSVNGNSAIFELMSPYEAILKVTADCAASTAVPVSF